MAQAATVFGREGVGEARIHESGDLPRKKPGGALRRGNSGCDSASWFERAVELEI